MTNKRNLTDYKMVIALSIAATACGGDDSSSSPPAPTTPSEESATIYYAQDVIRETVPTSSFYVDLSDSMESSDGTEVVLTNVTPLNSDDACRVTSISATGFSIDANNVKACDYRYKVGAAHSARSTSIVGDGYAEATVRAAVGEITEQLPPLSGVTSSNTSVTIDLVFELGNLGYDLDTSTYSLSTVVSLPNGDITQSTAIADPVGNTIEYTPGTGIPTGVERLLFSYSDGQNVLSGSLDVAISTETNTAPSAESMFISEYTHPETGYTVSKIPNGLSTNIDVSHLISDPDSDKLHLVDVYTFGATVSIPEDANGDGDHFNDTVFEFEGTTPGITNVTYVVSDGRGGYATGVLRLNVADVYDNIFLSTSEPNLLFAPPLTARVADAAEVDYVAVVGDGVTAVEDLATATHDWAAANGYCESTGGSLPTEADLQRLRQHLMDTDGTTSPELFQFHQWPEDLPYWSRTEGTTAGHYQAYHFGNESTLNNENGEQHYYVACLSNGAVEVRVSGATSIIPTVNPENPDPNAPDLTYDYQLIAIGADQSEEVLDSSVVSWTAFELPHYVDFSAEEGTLVIQQSNINEMDKTESLRLVGCIEGGICNELTVTINFTWNTIIETDLYQFTPFLNYERALEAGISLPKIDREDWSIGSGFVGDGFEGPYIVAASAVDYREICPQVNIDGGGWEAITSTSIFLDYTDALDRKFNDYQQFQGMTRHEIYSSIGLNRYYPTYGTGIPLIYFLYGHVEAPIFRRYDENHQLEVAPNFTYDAPADFGSWTVDPTAWWYVENNVICYRSK